MGFTVRAYWLLTMTPYFAWSEAEFKEFEPRLKIKSRLKYGFFKICIQFFKILAGAEL